MWHYKVHCILQFPTSTSTCTCRTSSCNLDKVNIQQQVKCTKPYFRNSKKQLHILFFTFKLVKICLWNLQKQNNGIKSWLFHWTNCLLYMYNAVFTFSYKYNYTYRYLEYFKVQQGYQIQIALFSMGNSKALSLQQYKIPKG